MLWITNHWLVINGELWVFLDSGHWVFFDYATLVVLGNTYMVHGTHGRTNEFNHVNKGNGKHRIYGRSIL